MRNSEGKCKLSLSAPAKVNLRLKVLSTRPDGYHDLEMILVKLDLHDELEFTIKKEDSGSFSLECSAAGVPTDSSNIIGRAYEEIRKISDKNFGLTVHLKKSIPVAAGLGGGSSDAAATLKALNALLNLNLSKSRLQEIGCRLGADVPFFFEEGAQWATGIGEKLKPIALSPLHLLLINPGFPVSTRDAFSWYDKEVGRSQRLTGEFGAASLPPLENDLEKVVLPRYPVLDEMKSLLGRSGAHETLMSGSGPTVFGLYPTQESRDRGYQQIVKIQDPKWWVCKTRSL